MVPLVLLIIIFISNQIFQYLGMSSYFTTSYLDDLICLPIVLFIVQFVHRYINKNNFILPISHIILSVIFFSIIFEIILPSFSLKYIGDTIDVFFYMTGAIIFYLINNRKSYIESVV